MDENKTKANIYTVLVMNVICGWNRIVLIRFVFVYVNIGRMNNTLGLHHNKKRVPVLLTVSLNFEYNNFNFDFKY